MNMKFLKTFLIIISIIFFTLPFISCTDDMMILFNEKLSNKSVIPLQMSWSTDQEHVDSSKGGGWHIDNDGRKIRFEIEDSMDCGGSNNSIQSGTAIAKITTGETYEFIPMIEGIGELQDTTYEKMEVRLNNELIIATKSKGGNLKCQMGPVKIKEYISPPYILNPGVHTFQIDFTTADGSYHSGAYYELNLIFAQ